MNKDFLIFSVGVGVGLLIASGKGQQILSNLAKAPAVKEIGNRISQAIAAPASTPVNNLPALKGD